MIRWTSLDPNNESLPSQSSFLPTGGDHSGSGTVNLTSCETTAETEAPATYISVADDSVDVSSDFSVAVIVHVIQKYHLLLYESGTCNLAEEVFSVQADQQRSADTAKCDWRAAASSTIIIAK